MNRLLRSVARAGMAAMILAGVAALADTARLLAAPFDPLAEVAAELGEPVTIAAVIEPGQAGGSDVLAVTATLEEGWHLYSITQKPGGPLPTRITLAPDSPRATSGPFVPDPAPGRRTVDDVPAWKGLPIEEHAGRVTWRAPLAAGAGEVRGAVRLQLCQDTSCLPPRTIEFVARLDGGKAAPAAASAVNHRPERSHVGLEARFGEPRQVDSVEAWPLLIRLVPDAGWHLYRPAADERTEVGQGKPTLLGVAAGRAGVLAVRATEAAAATQPELAEAGAVEGTVELEVLVAADPEAEESIDLVLGFQTCSENSCDPPTAVRVAVDPPAGGEPAFIEFTAAKYGEAARDPLPLEVAASSSGGHGGVATAGDVPPGPAFPRRRPACRFPWRS